MKRFLGCILLCSVASVGAETLTGVVKQPTPPFAPAADSTVTVLDNETQTMVGAPTTTAADGKYKVEVARGRKVTVRAVWDADQSMPGSTIATVSKNPTLADVQLQPPRGSAESAWYRSGVVTAKLGSGSVAVTASSLQSQEVAAAARYQFILGATSVDGSAFKGIGDLQMFHPQYADSVTKGLGVAESQFRTTQTLPTYMQFNESVRSVPVDVYLQVLAFLAPSDPRREEQWKRALSIATDSRSNDVVLWARKIDSTVSPVKTPAGGNF